MNIVELLELVGIALVAAVIGGALAGAKLGGKDLGYGLAAMMGGFYGPTAVLPAAVLGIVLLTCLK